MNIELLGVNRQNKGAELMMRALLYKIKERENDFVPVLGSGKGNIFLCKKENMLALPVIKKRGAIFTLPYYLFGIARLFGFNFVDRKNIDVIFDASGFAYSSSWGKGPIFQRINEISKWKKLDKNKKYIILPQAFGPFDNAEMKVGITELIGLADLCFVRDIQSYKYLIQAGVNEESITISPDFTCLIKPHKDIDKSLGGRVCIIPNYRMLDKQDSSDSKRYITDMAAIISELNTKKVPTFMLIHDSGRDFELAKKILLASKVNQQHCPIVFESDPIKIKSTISLSKLVVGSRYHGLASALSSGVPVIALGWSHKYRHIMEDYNIGYLTDLIQEKGVEAILSRVLEDSDFSSELLSKLSLGIEMVNSRSELMWSHIWSVLEGQDYV